MPEINLKFEISKSAVPQFSKRPAEEVTVLRVALVVNIPYANSHACEILDTRR
jgi:hypothetical protein